jgi:NAD(P)-dependent dehydrogenase (short-subunit alcohol dehydrogenase family)
VEAFIMSKKVILITGASSGIGKETAKKLLSEGQIVYAAARRVEQMHDLKKLGAITVQLDVSKEEELRACIDKIINTSSVAGKIYSPLGAWYHATKHALEGWSDCLRLEVKPFGIDVIIIEPGIIETSFGQVGSDPMLKNSGNGPYKDLAKAVVKVFKSSYQPGGGSSPAIIANIVSKAIKTKNPKTRYAAGKLAKPSIWMRKWLSDKAFDKIIMSMMK